MYEKNHQELYSSRTHTSRGQSVLQWLAGGFGVLMDFILKCKITPGMELFEQQYFTEQYIILTRTEEGYEKDY